MPIRGAHLARALAALLLSFALGGPAWAQNESGDDEARARRLFDEGHEATDRGDDAAACAKFEQSLALFRRASTLLNLGDCHQKLGHTATALGYWSEGAALLSSDDVRMGLAKEHIAALEQQVPRLVVHLPDPLPANAVITLDDHALTRAALAEPLKLDPGPHQLRLTAPGYQPNQLAPELRDGVISEVHLLLSPQAPAEVRAPEPRDHAVQPPRPDAPRPTPERRIPIWVWPVGSVGLVAAAASIPLTIDYVNTVSRQRERCGGDLRACRPDPPGSYDPSGDNARKRRDAVVGSIVGGGGGVLLAAAIIGAAIGEEASSEASLSLQPGPLSLTVRGAF